MENEVALPQSPKALDWQCSSAVLLSWSRGARPPSDPGSAPWPCSCVENHLPERNHGIQHTPHEPDLAWNAPSTTPHTSGWLCLLQLHVQFKIQLEIGNWLFLGSHMENAIIGPKKKNPAVRFFCNPAEGSEHDRGHYLSWQEYLKQTLAYLKICLMIFSQGESSVAENSTGK